jgi:hypothetical protein
MEPIKKYKYLGYLGLVLLLLLYFGQPDVMFGIPQLSFLGLSHIPNNIYTVLTIGLFIFILLCAYLNSKVNEGIKSSKHFDNIVRIVLYGLILFTVLIWYAVSQFKVKF